MYIWVFLLGFASPILILSGILFGKWVGTINFYNFNFFRCIIFVYFWKLFFSDLVQNHLKKKILKIYIFISKKRILLLFGIHRFIRRSWNTIWITKFNSDYFGNEKKEIFFASFLGFIPGFFIWNTIGAGLNLYIEKSDSFSLVKVNTFSRNLYPISMFSIVMIYFH